MAAWLADLSWPAVVGVMVLALAIAWLVEWVSWREAQAARLAAPRLDRHVEVEEPPPARPPEPEPAPEAPSVVEMAPPAAEPVPESVVVEADHDPVRVPPAAAEERKPAVPEPVEAEEPEPAVPEPVEPAPETESGEIGEGSEPGGTSMPDESEALAPRARRSWRGMSLRRVEPPEATTPGELPAPAERDRTGYPEGTATASGVKPPVEVRASTRARGATRVCTAAAGCHRLSLMKSLRSSRGPRQRGPHAAERDATRVEPLGAREPCP